MAAGRRPRHPTGQIIPVRHFDARRFLIYCRLKIASSFSPMIFAVTPSTRQCAKAIFPIPIRFGGSISQPRRRVAGEEPTLFFRCGKMYWGWAVFFCPARERNRPFAAVPARSPESRKEPCSALRRPRREIKWLVRGRRIKHPARPVHRERQGQFHAFAEKVGFDQAFLA